MSVSAVKLSESAPMAEMAHCATSTLFENLRRTRDPAVRAALVDRFLPLARKLARRYYFGGEPLEDLEQVASLGLIKAIERYDERRGVSFTSYAVPTITGELKRHFRDNGWAVHVPRGMRERAIEVNRAMRDITGRTGRIPSTREVSQKMKLAPQEVVDALGAYRALSAASLDAPVAGERDGETQTRGDTVGTIDDGYELVEDRLTVGSELRRLPLRERRVLHMRFVEERTQADIAAQIGVSQMQVSRILRRTLARVSRDVERGIAGEDATVTLLTPRGTDGGDEGSGPHQRAAVA